MVEAAIKAGGHAWVGFENNLWRRDGTLANGTHELVAKIEGDVMGADRIRALWGLLAGHSCISRHACAYALADKLIKHAPEGIERVYLVSGGSEAVEAAIKLARQYFVEKGEMERGHVIARKQSYHGNTLGALSAGAMNGGAANLPRFCWA